ncbi:MAG: putative CheA signal transduction histidine kinase [Bacillales bacterium]|jgi:two-component system chemotaxis sensor kinase CheA|nr:putative CheA signal transduction histidine kinase [Bacillales bacterium]
MINEKYIKAEYKLITDDESCNKILIILTDVTAEILLQKQIDNEKHILKMVVQAVTNKSTLLDLVKEYKDFANECNGVSLDSEKSIEDIIPDLFISIHTFKGIASQLEMFNLVNSLHEFENILAIAKRDKQLDHINEIKSIFKVNKLLEWINTDIDHIKNFLGENYLISEAKERLEYKQFKNLLQSYPSYVSRISKHLDKNVNNLVIHGGEFPVNAQNYKAFTKSLIHVFRNCVSHGIEQEDTRLSLEKPVAGTITCSISKDDNVINIQISDDGKGIDVNEIRSKAIEKEIYSFETIKALSNEEIINLIWLNDFSSTNFVSELSGRGVGLTAVKTALDELGGTVKIKTEIGFGTTFDFQIPLIDY